MNPIYEKYRDILIAPVRQCALYNPKFGQNKAGGFSYGEDVKWSYKVPAASGNVRELSLDGRIILDKIPDKNKKTVVAEWMGEVMVQLNLEPSVAKAMNGVVFEVRQGYKSKDSKRQNADISNAATAYTKGYVPCLMLMSSQIDGDVVSRYKLNKWSILQGCLNGTSVDSTYHFIENVIGFNFIDFMGDSQPYFRKEIHSVLEQLLRA